MDPMERKTPARVLDEDSELTAAVDDDEPTTEELVEMLRESLEDAKAGRTRPVEKLLRELDEILAENADDS